ncbi:MAG: putative CheY-like chemosensory protein [Firmicutes bacterium]|nr:putative CheY-like chemosensory protein [Bacillota bacterium]
MVSKETVLVIDDSPLICKIVEDILRMDCLDIIKANTGEDGLDLANDLVPNLILLDLILPKTNGFEICKQLKSSPITANIPIMFITAKQDSDIIIQCFEYGGVDYIAKPFVPMELKARVMVHLENQRAKNELNMVIKEMTKMVNHDYLTKIYSRRYFTNKLKMQLDTSTENMVIALGDIDNFKKVNDTYGHSMGDQVLNAVASIMNGVCRTNDIVARWGGEEFIIFFPNLTVDMAKLFIETIREKIAQTQMKYKENYFSVTITFGIVQISPDLTMEKNISFADTALYQGKESGKNCCIVYDGVVSE